MSSFQATVVALALVACASVQAAPTPTISLDQAYARVERQHPSLAVFAPQRSVLDAAAEHAALGPARTLSATIENALGSGEASAFDGAEFAVSLASAFERAGKREARLALVDRQRDALASQESIKRLDIYAEVARRYLDLVAAQADETIANDDVAQREKTVAAARRRVDAGASPASAHLAAQANLARATLQRERARQAQGAASARLALLWGGTDESAVAAVASTLALPEVPSFAELDSLLESTPDLQRYADEERLREARVQLARSQVGTDLEWSIGVRRLQATSDWGLVGSMSIPLGTRSRASSGIRAAQAELDALRYEREVGVLDLRSTLIEAQGRLAARVAEAGRLRDDVIPSYVAAESAAERAYRAGALSQLEWSQLQADTTAMRREQLAATVDAQRALIEIQRLTGRAPVADRSAPASERP